MRSWQLEALQSVSNGIYHKVAPLRGEAMRWFWLQPISLSELGAEESSFSFRMKVNLQKAMHFIKKYLVLLH